MTEILWSVAETVWATIGQMAPYLLLGYFAAGILSVLVSPALVQRHLGGNGTWAAVKAAIFGMPLPLCSCGVIPVTASLREQGAGKGAVAAFLISTPTTGVDSIAAAWSLMGPVFALYRAAMAVVLGICGGIMANLFGGRDNGIPTGSGGTAPVAPPCGGDGEPPVPLSAPEPSCPHCAAAAKAAAEAARLAAARETVATGSCCGSGTTPSRQSQSATPENVVWRALRYGFCQLPRTLSGPLALGILAAGLIAVLVREEVLTPFLGAGFGTMLLMLAIGLPLYICSTAAIPLALGFLALGASPGAAMVFLIAGPAANAATVTVLWKLIGGRSTVIVFLTIAAGAIGGGLLLDQLWALGGYTMPAHAMHHHHEALSSWLTNATAGLFVLVQLWSVWGSRILFVLGRSKKKPSSSCCEKN